MATSIFSRKLDLFYMAFFIFSVPQMLLIDLQTIYPASIVPAFAKSLEQFYVTTFNDKFFIGTPQPFFEFWVWSELWYQIPVMIWAIGGLYRNSPKVPLVLLPYSVVYALTTATCIYEFAFWDSPRPEKLALVGCYAPVLVIALTMLFDMYSRLNKVIDLATDRKNVTKGKKSK